MPLTRKGEKIKSAMVAEYGAEKGEKVFYASKNAGKISGVDEMNGGTEGLKTYGDAHHHEFEGNTGREIEDKRRDAGMGLVHAKEEALAASAPNPKPLDAVDAAIHREFPHDPFGDTNPDGGFKFERVWSASEMRNSPFAVFKE